MDKRIGTQTREELVRVLGRRYHDSSKMAKTLILNDLVAVSGYHRKHAIRLLGSEGGNGHMQMLPCEVYHSRRIYDETVKEAVIVTWEAADRICGKRLKAVLPDLVNAMERHGHLNLDLEVRKRLLKASASTIARLLSPIRNRSQSHRKRHKSPRVSKQVPVHTFADWDGPNPGYFEIDFVAHCGGLMAESFIHTLVATDVSSGWTELMPLLAREQSLVVRGLRHFFNRFHFRCLASIQIMTARS